MFTSSEIQEKEFKTGIGYDKKEVEQFLKEVSLDYTSLLQENEELKEKWKNADQSLSYYKSIEKALQKALILAEKTAQATKNTALKEAEVIEQEARAKANLILEDARKQLEFLEHKTLNLIQQYDLFKIHFESLLKAQIELINSRSFSLDTKDFYYHEPKESKGAELKSSATDEENVTTAEVEKELSMQYEEEMSDLNQIKFDFLEEPEENSFHTEDGFEFFTMKDD